MLNYINKTFQKAIAFIDAAVPDCQTLIDGIRPEIEVIKLESNCNAIEQIAEALQRGKFSVIHIISHGQPGGLQLGNVELSWDKLGDRAGNFALAIKEWGRSLTPEAEILIYGCNVAQGNIGKAFIKSLSQLTGASVAASENLTGCAALGGDWELTATVGKIQASKAFRPELMAVYSHVLNTFKQTPNSLTTGTNPAAIVSQDFNGDGLPDLAVANRSSDSVSILLGTGQGNFGTATNLTLGSAGSPSGIVAGNFNGDTLPDLAVSTAIGGDIGGGVYVLLGTGQGNFSNPNNFGPGISKQAIAAGDFNKDGFADLVVAEDNQVSIALGTGQGTFGNFNSVGSATSPLAIAIGDFNADNNLDIVATTRNPANSIAIFSGTGQGTFGTSVNLTVGTSPSAIAVGDFNADGRSDLAVANGGGNVSILLGTSQGTFSNPANFNVGESPNDISVGDFNADGKPDLAVANVSSNDVSILTGTGQGTFNGPFNYNTGGTTPSAIEVGDFNSDSRPDIAVTNTNSNNVTILLNILLKTGFGAPTYTVAEGDTDATVNIPVIIEDGLRFSDLIIPIATALPVPAGTAAATQGSDYTLSTNTLTFPAGSGSLTQNIAVTIKPDNLAEIDEAVVLSFGTQPTNSLPIALGTIPQSTITIPANDPIIYTVGASAGTIPEGNSGANPLIFTVGRSGGTDSAGTVNYAIGGTANNGSDYNNIGGTSGATSTTSLINFASGETSKTITLDVLGDGSVEPDETIILTLSNPVTLPNGIFPGGSSTIGTATATTTIINDDRPGITVDPISGLLTTETGGSATFRVKLNSQPSANVTVALSSSNPVEGTVSTPTLTFTPANWNQLQTVTVTGVDDNIADGNIAYNIVTANAVSTDSNYNNLNPDDVSVTNTDNENPGITVNPTAGLTTTEAGGTANFSVVLNTQPTAPVTIALSSSNPAEGTVSTNSLSFTPNNWNQQQTVTATGVSDNIADGSQTYSIITGAAVSTDSNYNNFNPSDVSVTNTDSNAAGITVNPASTAATEGGANGSYTIKLNSQPTAPVTISFAAGNQISTIAPITFDAANWNVAQTVTAIATDDAVVEGAHSGTINHAVTSTDVKYSGSAIAPVTVAITDNDITPTPTPTPPTPTPPTPTPPTPTPPTPTPPTPTPPTPPTPTPTPTPTPSVLPVIMPPTIPAGITVDPTSGLVTTEAGGKATFTVKLNTPPTADVRIDLESSNPAEGIISPPSLNFNFANWNQTQTVTVTGVDDKVVDGNKTYSIVTKPAVSNDRNYSGLNAADAIVTSTDNGGNNTGLPIDRATGVAYKPGELLVKLRQGIGNEAIQSAFQVNGAIEIENLVPPTEQLSSTPRRLDRWRVVKFATDADLLQIQRNLASDFRIEAVQLNYLESINAVPDDTRFSELWGLNNTGADGGTADADIDAPEAWDTATGSSSVIVAVVDSGVDYNHEDLAANMWTNSGEIAGNGIDDDGNGYTDDVRGYDFANNDSDPMDDNGHGSHVAGTVGAVGNNALGVTGVNQSVQLMPLKFIEGRTGSVANAARAIRYATDKGADVINYSAGGYRPSDFDPRSDVRYDAIADANDAGALFVAAAGNDANNNDSNLFYPANFDLPNVISVAATDRNDGLWSSSNFGATTVDLGAPGSSILSTVPGNNYAFYSGTSMAAPHVAGAAALLLAQDPTLTVTQLKNSLLSNVDLLPSLAGRTATGGRLNLRKAFNRPPVVNRSVFSQSAALGFSQAGNTFTLVANTDTDPDPGDSINYAIALANFSDLSSSAFTWETDLNGGSYRKPIAGSSFPEILLPSWLTFNSATRTINLGSRRPDSFNYWLKVTGTDESGARVSEIIRFKSYALGGFVIDGYIAGATVFFDANKNGVLDASEPSATTGDNGEYDLDLDSNVFDKNQNGELDPEEGNIVAFGGIDTATNLPLETPVTAPPYATVVTLLTSLVADLIDKGIDSDRAESLVKSALSIPAEVNITDLDPIAATENAIAGGLETLTAMVKVQNVITQTAAFLDGGSILDNTDTVKAVVSAIVQQIQSGTNLNLNDANQLESIVRQSITIAQQFDSTFNAQQLSQIAPDAAKVIAAANQRIDTVVFNTATVSINREIARVQKVALGNTSADLKAVGAGTKSIAQVVAENTGIALDTKIQQTTLPEVPAIPIIAGEIDAIAANSNIIGTDGDDSLSGDSGSDTISGKRGSDTLTGLGGNDWIHGNQGNDSLDGGDGDETLYGGKGIDSLFGNNGADILFGNRGQDSLIGGEGNDSLYGGKASDILLGSNGDDFLNGENGDDSLIGGNGSDRFLLSTNSGSDTILEFADGIDFLALAENLNFSQLSIIPSNNSTLIRLAATNQILATLNGASANQITIADFS